jgi:hypothetical protein
MRSSRSAFWTHTLSPWTHTRSGPVHSSFAGSSRPSASSSSRTATPGRACSVSSWHNHHPLSKLLVGMNGEGVDHEYKRQGRICTSIDWSTPEPHRWPPCNLFFYHRRNPRPPPKTLPRPPPRGSPPQPTPKTGP